MQTGNYYLLHVHGYRDAFIILDFANSRSTSWAQSLDELVLDWHSLSNLPSLHDIHAHFTAESVHHSLTRISNPATIRQDHPELFL